jgi:hypothetical protein
MELRMLNQNTFFHLHQLLNHLDTPSAVHIAYGDCKLIGCLFVIVVTSSFFASVVANTHDKIETKGLTLEQFENVSSPLSAFAFQLFLYFCVC